MELTSSLANYSQPFPPDALTIIEPLAFFQDISTRQQQIYIEIQQLG